MSFSKRLKVCFSLDVYIPLVVLLDNVINLSCVNVIYNLVELFNYTSGLFSCFYTHKRDGRPSFFFPVNSLKHFTLTNKVTTPCLSLIVHTVGTYIISKHISMEQPAFSRSFFYNKPNSKSIIINKTSIRVYTIHCTTFEGCLFVYILTLSIIPNLITD